MRTEIKYIEQKNGFSDKGPAWIGLVSYSKSGKTIYFNGIALQSLKGARSGGNYFDLETDDEYWVSGVKKDMSDRHWAGGGKIFVEKRILSNYLKIVDRTELPKRDYELVTVETKIPIERITKLENTTNIEPEFDESIYIKNANELTVEELEFLIEELIEDEKQAIYNKGRRLIKKDRIELEVELEKREIKNVG